MAKLSGRGLALYCLVKATGGGRRCNGIDGGHTVSGAHCGLISDFFFFASPVAGALVISCNLARLGSFFF